MTEIKKLSAKGGTLEYHTDSVNKLQQKHEKVKQFLENNQEKYHITCKRKQVNPIIGEIVIKKDLECQIYPAKSSPNIQKWLRQLDSNQRPSG